MAEYIDREKYCEEICLCDKSSCDKSKCQIFKAPAEKVIPEKRGKWMLVADVNFAKCSKCGEEFDCGEGSIEDFEKFYKFCPNCGAKMEESGEGYDI